MKILLYMICEMIYWKIEHCSEQLFDKSRYIDLNKLSE